MTIMLDESIRAVWFAQLSDTSDFMAGLNTLPDGNLRLTWRFRYDHPTIQDVWELADEKSWGHANITHEANEARVVSAVRQMIEAMVEDAKQRHQLTGKRKHVLAQLVRGKKSVKEFFEEMQRQPWAHVKRTQ